MTKLEKKIMKLIKASKGTSWKDIANQLNRTQASLTKAMNTLYKDGYICQHFGGKIHPFYRSIDVYKKGKDEIIRERYHVHGIMTSRAEVLVEEIQLPNIITTSQLRKVIRHLDDDYYYIAFHYGIDENSASLFERTNSVKFDFKNFEYILG